MKFKIGDRVSILSAGVVCGHFTVGKCGTVRGYNFRPDGIRYMVQIDGYTNEIDETGHYYYLERSLRLIYRVEDWCETHKELVKKYNDSLKKERKNNIKFEIEDRVKHTKYGAGKVIDTKTQSWSYLYTLVEFDKSNTDLHSGKGKGKPESCWWCDDDSLTLINSEFDWVKFTGGEFVVRCSTKEASNRFLQECEKRDIKWQSYDNPTDRDYWDSMIGKIEYRHSFGGLSYRLYDFEENGNIVEFDNKELHFNRANLRTGDVLEHRNGTLAMVLLNTNNGDVVSGCDTSYELCKINNSLLDIYDNKNFDIMAVYRAEYSYDILSKGIHKNHTCIWKREEPVSVSKEEVMEILREHFDGKEVNIESEGYL